MAPHYDAETDTCLITDGNIFGISKAGDSYALHKFKLALAIDESQKEPNKVPKCVI